MNKNDLVRWFILNFPKTVKEMSNSNHAYDEKNLSPYHMEGDIFTHTMMVVNALKGTGIECILICLLHDIGKPICRDPLHDRKYVRFLGHEPMSAFLSLSILNKFEEDFPDIKIDKEKIFKVISIHTEPYKIPHKLNDRLINQDLSFLWTLNACSDADENGRFHTEDGASKRDGWKYELKTREIKEKEKEAIVLVGLPCSGKSTYIKQLETRPLKSHSVISRDDILMSFQGKTYNEKWKNADQKEVDRVLQDWKKRCIDSGDNLIFDMTHMSRKSRRKSLHGLPNNYKKKAVVFLPTLETIVDRNEKRSKENGKTIPEDVYESMIKAFYPPMYDEFDEIEWRFE